jgi:hypothetical protein
MKIPKILPKDITIGDAYNPAMEITTQEDADAYFDLLVRSSMKNYGNTKEKAIENEKSNLGYYAGYFDAETRARVYKLFQCQHPIFGLIEPTPEEAFDKGVKSTK